MDFLTETFTEVEIYGFELTIDYWVFIFAMAFLGFELLRLTVKKMMSWNLIGDTVTNFLTLIAFLGVNFTIAGAYVGAFFYVYENWSITQLPINGWLIIGAVVLADIAYYWEHRFMHRFGLGWATHAVHHSSPYFNISVAYRFGPLDGIFPIIFHLPLAVIGIHPFVIFLAEAAVQLYQTLLHTEAVGKLPRPIEYFMNTPSHHRVHHGSNEQYLDKNYAGIFIIWDRIFGTFAEEKEKVSFGVTEPINTINPFAVFFCGFAWMWKRFRAAQGVSNKMKALVLPPDWSPKSN
ncbi:MAG: sterol desaturase family protein [Kordiimonas sp.]